MSPFLVLMMAIASGATVASLYYNQPLLALLAQEFHASVREIGFIPTLIQIGYAVGILLFVPLGDLVERRKLIVTMLSCTAGALALAALAPNLIWLVVASFAIGMTAIAAQIMVPFAAQLTPPQERGKVVGTVMSGLLIGILLARTVSGVVAAVWGWRSMYWLATGLMLILAGVMWRILPASQPSLKMSYVYLMGSLSRLMREQPVLRQAALMGGLSFATFSVFWTTLAFFLEQPPYHYGSDVAGLFGLVGVVGAMAAPLAGKLADRYSPRLPVGLGITTSMLSFLVFWSVGDQLWGLILGVILLDFGIQTTQISNQASIYRLPQEIHSRLNALYITFYFVGGALGSLLGAYSWSRWHWNGVCGVSLALLTIALFTFWRQKH